jgi:ketosteroid isomerase-like protein
MINATFPVIRSRVPFGRKRKPGSLVRDTQRAKSEASVAGVRGMWNAFLRNDAETALAAFDPDVVWDGTNLPDGKIARGLEAVVDHTTRWAEMWDVWEVELEDVIDAGQDQVIAFIRERGRSKAGLDVNELHSELYRIRDGKITYRKGFSDADDALVDAGLR